MISQSDFTVRKNHKLRIQWPNLGIDQKAWELAKVASEPGEALSVTIARAQKIKETLSVTIARAQKIKETPCD